MLHKQVDQADILSELNRKFTSPVIPNLKKLSRLIDKSLVQKSAAVLSELQKQKPSPESYLNILNDLLAHLQKAKEAGLVVLDKSSVCAIYSIIGLWKTMTDASTIDINNKEKADEFDPSPIVYTALMTYLIIENNFISQSSVKKAINPINPILKIDLINRFIELGIAANPSDTSLIPALEILKINIDAFKGTLTRSYYFNNLRLFYHHSATNNYSLNNFNKAKKQGLKCARAYEEAKVLDTGVPELFKMLAKKSYSLNNFEDAIFWGNLTSETMEETITLKQFLGLPPAYLKYYRDQYAIDRRFLEFFITNAQKKLREQLKGEVISFADKANVKFEFADGLNHLVIDEDQKYLEKLTWKLNKANIICHYNENIKKIVFNDLIDIKIEAFKKIVTSFLGEVKKQKARNLSQLAVDNAELITTVPVTDTSLLKSESAALPIAIKKEKKKTKGPQITSEPAIVDRHEISWGEEYPVYRNNQGSVFKLIGSTAHNQYLYIKHGFFAQVNRANPDAARTLLNICERGKVINDSTGNKGIIIEGDNVKIKDSSKAYRFYGHRVATTNHKDKVCQLNQIDSWHPDPH